MVSILGRWHHRNAVEKTAKVDLTYFKLNFYDEENVHGHKYFVPCDPYFATIYNVWLKYCNVNSSNRFC
jgi:hypothetical protein